MFRVLAWGCGVQSTALAVMSAQGHLPHLDAVINADLQWERQVTYNTRDFYTIWLRQQGLYVEILQADNIRELGAREHTHVPFWTSNGGPLRRQCTRHFKIRPQHRRIREILGYHSSTPPHPPAGTVEKWIGYSIDEWQRAKPSRIQYTVNRWPLIEMKMTRTDCADYLESHELPVPSKSACIGCPYRSAAEWIQMRDEAPDEWEDACQFDEENRNNPLAATAHSTADQLFIWRGKWPEKPSPLRTADLEGAVRPRRHKQLPLLILQ